MNGDAHFLAPKGGGSDGVATQKWRDEALLQKQPSLAFDKGLRLFDVKPIEMTSAQATGRLIR